MSSEQHAHLVDQVVAAHEELTGEAPDPCEYGMIQAVVRDELNEETRK
jgi:hypothetical protein